MNTKKSAVKVFVTIAVFLLMIVPLAIGAGYAFWASAADKDSGGYKFWAGLFGERYDGVAEPVFAYDSVYASAKAISADIKSPVYVLRDDLLIDIPKADFVDRLPIDATKELYIPADMRYEGIGLFVCYRDTNGHFAIAKTTTQAALDLFDASKPTFIFIHGMQYLRGGYEDEDSSYLAPLIDAGYNVLLFRWSQFTDEATPMDIEPKLWGTDQDKAMRLFGMRWRDIDGKYVEDDIPNASVAEIFGAYYLDLMYRFDYKGSSITLSGHSMGGPTAIAATSYLLAKEQEGLISPAYLPDRVTLFDPYLATFSNEVYCPWLGYNITRPLLDAQGNQVYDTNGAPKYTSSLDVIVDLVKDFRERGIAIEYIPSITGQVWVLLYVPDPNDTRLADNFYDNIVALHYRSDWVDNPIANFDGYHSSGRNWYCNSVLYDYVADSAMDDSPDLAPTARTPLSYLFARMGTTYLMDENMTLDIADDVIKASDIPCAKVAGFAFEDTNRNRTYDERLQARMAGVKLELYHKDGKQDKLIATCITDESGYYSFDIPRINSNKFDKFYVRAVAPEGYKICGRGASEYLMDNDINPTVGLSDEFSLMHLKNLKIINIGLEKHPLV